MSNYTSPLYTSAAWSYFPQPFMSDAYIGTIFMIVAAVCGGIVLGTHWSKNSYNVRFDVPKSITISVAKIVFFTGTLMRASSTLLVGVYQYSAFALISMVVGFSLVLCTAVVWGCVLQIAAPVSKYLITHFYQKYCDENSLKTSTDKFRLTMLRKPSRP